MNIQSISCVNNLLYKNFSCDKKNKLSFRSQRLAAAADTFVRSPKSLLESALAKLRKITLSEYKSLTKEEILALRSEISSIKNHNTGVEVLNQDIKMHHYITEAIKQSFDKEFGVGKYVVIAIGRSLSSISKLLGLKIGEQNVKNIPMSHLTIIDTQGANQLQEWATERESIAYKKYLESIGLTRQAVEDSNKTYVIMDYAFSGKSLKNAYKILTSDSFLGNKNRNITTVSTQEILPLHYPDERTQLALDLQRSSYKYYSFVDKINIFDEKSLARSVDFNRFCSSEQQLKLRRLFGFGILDSMQNSDRKNLYQNLEFKISPRFYPGQNKKRWLTEVTQYKKDLFEDDYELEKALSRVRQDNNPKLEDKIISLLLEIRKYPPEPMFYYRSLRPQILKIVSEV